MARALAASGVSIFASASTYKSRTGGAESSRRPTVNALTATGSSMARMFSRACWSRSPPSQPRQSFSFWNHSCWAASCVMLLLDQLLFLGQHPFALVLHVAALGHDLVSRNPLAVELAIAQGVAGLGVVGVELDHPLQVHLALLRSACAPGTIGPTPIGPPPCRDRWAESARTRPPRDAGGGPVGPGPHRA